MEIIYRKLSELKKLEGNPRKITHEALETLKRSLMANTDYFEARPIILSDRTGELVVIAGNQRYEACKQLGWSEVPTVLLSGLTEEREKEIIIRDNVNNGEWDENLLMDWDIELLSDWGVDIPDWEEKERSPKVKNEFKSLTDKFIIPPFSILDTKMGYWQERKREWLSIGIKSEIGRAGELTYAKSCQSPAVYEVKNYLREKNGSEPSWNEVIAYCKGNGIAIQNGTSVFDPVLCEVSYRWFCPENGRILDPFAGGSVRGIVASKLGFRYEGNDLRREQVEANIDNAKEVLTENIPIWTCGDSNEIDKMKEGQEYDMVFSCPPYADLEVYSDNEKDLSTMDYPQFLEVYRSIISKCCSLLKEDRFAVFVVGEVRDKGGGYYNFVADTIKAFMDAGMIYYNEIVITNSTSSAAMKVSRQFNTSRKVGKVHQNVLVFYKGYPKNINNNFHELDFSIVEDMIGGDDNG